MSVTETQSSPKGSLLASILSEDSFRPAEPKTIEETGLTAAPDREPDPQVRDADRLGQRAADLPTASACRSASWSRFFSRSGSGNC